MAALFQSLLEANSLSSSGKAFLTTEGYLFAWGKTVPSAEEGYAPGCLFVHTDGADASSLAYVNTGTKDSSTFTAFDVSSTLASTSTSQGASLVGVEDSGGHTTSTTVEAVLAEILQHLKSAQTIIPVPLYTVRETTNFDVGNIAANGGLLASDTTPILEAINAATDGCQRLNWAAGNADQVTFQVTLDPAVDTAENMQVHVRAAMGGSTDTPDITVDSFWNESDTKIVDTIADITGTSYAEYAASIQGADIPSDARTVTIGLTPAAHATDALFMTAIWLSYTPALLTQ